jgi:hypothetical protein
MKSLEERQERNLQPTELTSDNFEEKFWMRDSVALKRLELLVGMAEKAIKPKKTPKRDFVDVRNNGTPQSMDKKLKAQFSAPQATPEGSAISNFDYSETPTNSKHSDSTSSGENTDDLISTANKILKKRRRMPKMKMDLGHMPQVPLFQGDENMIARELDRLKNEYKHLVPPALMAPIIADQGLKRVTESDFSSDTKRHKYEQSPDVEMQA